MLDFAMILAPLLQLWWLLPIIVIITFFKSPIGKGIVGEGLLNFIIKTVQDFADSKKDALTEKEKIEKDKYTGFGSFSSAILFINFCRDYSIDDLKQQIS